MEFYMHVSNTATEAAHGSFGAASGAGKIAVWSRKICSLEQEKNALEQ